jgi:predicted TIM-barrel fold metal-dependent hydrolase
MQTPWGDLPVSDAHVHFFSHRFFQSLAGQQHDIPSLQAKLGWHIPPVDPVSLAETWATELNRHGVERAAIIASTPGDESSVLAATSAFPNRFLSFAMVNPAAEHAAVAPGLKAVCLFPAMHRYALHDPRVEAIIEQAAAQHSAVFVHCGVLTVGVRKKLGLPSPFDMRFSNPLDLHAIALRHPRTPFIVPHFGAGFLREALMLADLCPNVLLDTSSSNSWMRYEELDLRHVFRRALEIVGPQRLLFGTDSSFFPRGWHAAVFEAQTQALYELGLSAADARLILGENLQRVFS